MLFIITISGNVALNPVRIYDLSASDLNIINIVSSPANVPITPRSCMASSVAATAPAYPGMVCRTHICPDISIVRLPGTIDEALGFLNGCAPVVLCDSTYLYPSESVTLATFNSLKSLERVAWVVVILCSFNNSSKSSWLRIVLL